MTKSTRLTNDIRDRIVADLLRHAFEDKSKAIIDEQIQLGEDVYDDVMNSTMPRTNGGKGPAKKLKHLIEELPAAWPVPSMNMKVVFGGNMEQIDREKGFQFQYGYRSSNGLIAPKTINTTEKWLFAPNYQRGQTFATYDSDHVFTERCNDLRERHKDLSEQIEQMRATTRATLSSANTIQKLITMWPEIETFAAPYLQPNTAAAAFLPMVTRQKLNETLGLPPDAQMAS